jgi:ABC-type multidrug transport system permease subunit
MILRRRERWLHNSFRMLADVRLRPGGHGTQVEITLRSQNSAAVLVTLWLGLVVLVTIVFFGSVLNGTNPPELLVVMPFFLFFGLGFMAVGRLLARSDRAALLEFIARVTDGQRYADALLPPM